MEICKVLLTIEKLQRAALVAETMKSVVCERGPRGVHLRPRYYPHVGGAATAPIPQGCICACGRSVHHTCTRRLWADTRGCKAGSVSSRVQPAILFNRARF